MEEEWRDIIGYEGLYQVSTHGRIKALQRAVPRRNIMHPYKERIRKQGVTARGYCVVSLCKQGKTTWFSVHRLVAKHYLLDYSQELLVNHINNVKVDNRLANLEMTTSRYNNHHYKMQICGQKFIGITENKGRNTYAARITHHKIPYFLGSFKTKEEAQNAYYAKLKELEDADKL